MTEKPTVDHEKYLVLFDSPAYHSTYYYLADNEEVATTFAHSYAAHSLARHSKISPKRNIEHVSYTEDGIAFVGINNGNTKTMLDSLPHTPVALDAEAIDFINSEEWQKEEGYDILEYTYINKLLIEATRTHIDQFSRFNNAVLKDIPNLEMIVLLQVEATRNSALQTRSLAHEIINNPDNENVPAVPFVIMVDREKVSQLSAGDMPDYACLDIVPQLTNTPEETE